ncbi:MAG: PIG-L family deacetylase [Gaiellaceae bacterium]|jgi:LmbE family N-acetylglucosaminyl deacetylase
MSTISTFFTTGKRRRLSLGEFGEDIVVLSPHLDDAILSLGAAISQATRRGKRIRIVTVFAGDPESELPSTGWDSLTGFTSVGEAARSRRLEDEKACSIVGVEPVWLPFPDNEQGGPPDVEEVTVALYSAVAGADAILVPGFPLLHPDHDWLARLIRRLELGPRRVVPYLEQPYALQHPTKSPPASTDGHRWLPLHSGPSDMLAKIRACRSYRSQIRTLGGWWVLGGWLMLAKMTMQELHCGGELVLADFPD